MIEKIIYVACDGKEFSIKDECVKYEASLVQPDGLLMIDFSGKETNRLGDAAAIYISYESEKVYAWLDSAADRERTNHDGIERGDVGLYYWDEIEAIYKYLPKDIARIIAEYFEIKKF